MGSGPDPRREGSFSYRSETRCSVWKAGPELSLRLPGPNGVGADRRRLSPRAAARGPGRDPDRDSSLRLGMTDPSGPLLPASIRQLNDTITLASLFWLRRRRKVFPRRKLRLARSLAEDLPQPHGNHRSSGVRVDPNRTYSIASSYQVVDLLTDDQRWRAGHMALPDMRSLPR